MAVIGTKTKSAETAGERVKAMLEKLVAKGFGDTMNGKPLAEMLGTIREQGLSGAKMQEWWGSTEAASAFGLLDPDQFAAMRAELDRAQEVNLADYPIYAAGQNPLIAATKNKRKALARKEMAEMADLGVKTLRNDALQAGYMANLREEGGHSEFQLGMYEFGESFIRTALGAIPGGEDIYARSTARLAAQPEAAALREAAADLKDAARLMKDKSPTLARPDQDR